MNIYFSHSQEFDYRKDFYIPLRNSSLHLEHTLILPHEELDGAVDARELFRSGGCDVVIAEVSHPLVEQGIELGWADMAGIPIICIHKDGVVVNESLRNLSKRFLMYTSLENMIDDIKGGIKQYE